MHVEYGPHEGKAITFVFLRYPDFVLDTLMPPSAHTPSSRPIFETREFPPKGWPTETAVDPAQKEALAIEFRGLMPIFDAKPIVKPCLGEGCENNATCLSICRDNIDMLRWWCDDCDPCQQGAARDRIQVLRTYMDALTHIQQFCNRRKGDCRELIGEIARAKGLPKSYNEARAAKFFAE